MTTQTIRFFSVITLIFSLITSSTIANAVSLTVNSLADTMWTWRSIPSVERAQEMGVSPPVKRMSAFLPDLPPADLQC
jgi:hypothetical protein